MNQSDSSPQPKKGNAATCWIVGGILVFIGIFVVAILAAFVFPAAKGVMAKAEQANAENTAHNLKNANFAYFTEYRKYPTSEKTGPGAADTTVDSTSDLLGALMGNDPIKNDRDIQFYSGKAARQKAAAASAKAMTRELRRGN